MGRYSTGAITTGQVTRIELSYLIKNNIIKKHHCYTGSISWTNDNSIGIKTVYNDTERYIVLDYTITVHATKEKTYHNYKIQMETVPSNLGKGEVLYFVCPVTGKRCRILYKCYGSLIWKSREAYQNRIYYESQIEPKSIRPFKNLFVDNQLSELYQKAKKSHYRGKPTRLMQRIDKLNRLNDAAMIHYDRFERLMCGVK